MAGTFTNNASPSSQRRPRRKQQRQPERRGHASPTNMDGAQPRRRRPRPDDQFEQKLQRSAAAPPPPLHQSPANFFQPQKQSPYASPPRSDHERAGGRGAQDMFRQHGKYDEEEDVAGVHAFDGAKEGGSIDGGISEAGSSAPCCKTVTGSLLTFSSFSFAVPSVSAPASQHRSIPQSQRFMQRPSPEVSQIPCVPCLAAPQNVSLISLHVNKLTASDLPSCLALCTAAG